MNELISREDAGIVDRRTLTGKPVINAVSLESSSDYITQMLQRLYHNLDAVSYKVECSRFYAYDKGAVVKILRNIQEYISDIMEGKVIDKVCDKDKPLLDYLLLGEELNPCNTLNTESMTDFTSSEWIPEASHLLP